MTSDTRGPMADTSDMLGVHQVFREAFGTSDQLLRSADGRAERTALLADYYRNVLAFLEVHHDTEELLVFSLLEERCPEQGELLRAMRQEHEGVVDGVVAARQAIDTWSSAPGPQTRDAAAAALAHLGATAVRHMDHEEAEILPLAARHMSAEEWGALPGYGMANFDGDKIWLILGLIREQMTPEQRDAMLEHMPPPAVAMWVGMGNAAFDAIITEVRRSA
jgi:hypothetical protein